MNWFRKRKTTADRRFGGQTTKPDVRQKVLLLIDIFTNYHDPEIARAAVHVLEALDYQVLVREVETGRPHLSKGRLDKARELAEENIKTLFPFASQDIPVVGLEPSEILTLRDEYPDLCDDDDTHEKANVLGNAAYQFEEYFVRCLLEQPEKTSLFNGSEQQVYLHGHCHAKALVGNDPTLEALKAANYKPTDLETGCCGMAGSFGYEADHYDVSMDIGELVLFPALRQTQGDSLICAPGFSCRHQIRDGVERKAHHPAELLHRAMRL